MKKTAAAALAVALLLSPESERSAFAVEGGEIDRSITHAVAIAKSQPSRDAVSCTGTLISENVVLTVRHCVAAVRSAAAQCDATLGDPIDARDLWITSASRAEEAPSMMWKRGRSVVVPEAGNNRLCGDDVALIVLESSFRESEALPARPVVDRASFEKAIGSHRIGLAAFGATSVSASDVGTRRSRFDIPIGCVPNNSAFRCGPELDFIGLRELTTGGRGPCRGDSGAGALTSEDHNAILGVLSRGDRGEDAESCALGVFERTDVWAWLLGATVIDAARSAQSPAPAWATDLFPANPKPGEMCLRNTSAAASEKACGSTAECVSLDNRRSFICATSCESNATCEAGSECTSGVCIPSAAKEEPPIESSCSVRSVSSQDRSTPFMMATIVVTLLFFSLSRRRVRA